MHDVSDLRRRRRWQLGALLAAAAAAAALGVAVSTTHTPPVLRPGAAVPGAKQVTAMLSGLAQQGVALGDVHAPVTLVEFGDLQCPGCAQFARAALPVLVAREVRAARLRIVFRPLDFLGSDSVRGARMALAAGEQNRLWQFIELFYDNQRDENTGYATDAFVTALGEAIGGLDTARALTRRASSSVSDELASAAAEARRRQLRSTPAFLLGRSGGVLRTFVPNDLSAASFTAPIEHVAGAARPSGSGV